MKSIIRMIMAIAPLLLLGACNDSVVQLKGHIVDVEKQTVYDGEILVKDGKIASITPCAGLPADAQFIVPGFVDSHVHTESSMMMPSEFARIALRYGTVGAVCDPHEIANVLGERGIELLLDDARDVPFCFAFGVPSCVPSCDSGIETSGAVLDSKCVERLIKRKEFYHLSEMMNYPGVLNGDKEVMAKIAAARKARKPVDGHAPGVVGEQRARYAAAGISTDHECSELEEAREALRNGMSVLIREGSAAKNYAALSPLIAEAPDKVMLCTDDSHPTDLVQGHINRLVARALGDGFRFMDVMRAASLNPIRHYRLPVGLLKVGDSADFICLSDTTPRFKVVSTYVAGKCVEDLASKGVAYDESMQVCKAKPVSAADMNADGDKGPHHVIVATDGSLLTKHEVHENIPGDCQKIVTYNRYSADAKPRVAYIRGFNMKKGAFAQTIAHDCHNIIAVGTSDDMLAAVINKVIEMKGGIAVTDGKETVALELPIAGLISPLPGEELARKNAELENMVKRTGCTMQSPFITLGFMALPVIPELKLTDKGLFDGAKFEFVGKPSL